MSFMIETSARHIHLTQESVEKLFGEGYQLTIRKPLSYPGQYASNERLTIVGPKKEMANVSILGPVRKADQVEISATDARTLGIDAPIRESGDVKGSGACKLIGPKGEIDLTEGVIVAKRHLHVTEEDAAEMGLKDKEIIRVSCGGEGRKLIFDDVVVRVNVGGATTMHIDTDEAQAAGNPPWARSSADSDTYKKDDAPGSVIFCYAKNKMRHFLAPSGQPKMMRKNFMRSGFCP